jgi:hypothetical protein
MDVREANAITRSLSHFPLQAAFRFNRKAADAPKLSLEWRQFSDADVLSAVAERATVTTLMNVEGRSLTEITLRVRNRAQQFVKVDLPAGAQLLSAEVEGQSVKPVDGNRVPLLRTGLDSSGAYTVSFVYLSSGAKFAKTGSYDMGLPRLDIPVNLLLWEVSLPERLQVKQFGGNALSAELFPEGVLSASADGADEVTGGYVGGGVRTDLASIGAGQISGVIVDANGAAIPGAAVTVNTQTGATLNTRSNDEGRWIIAGVAPGPVRVNINSPGFKDMQYDLQVSEGRGASLGTTMEVGTVTETVTVTASGGGAINGTRNDSKESRNNFLVDLNAPSQNVFNLQRRVAGILPVRIDVPRSGRSYRFVRPLVLDEETRITFQYKSK